MTHQSTLLPVLEIAGYVSLVVSSVGGTAPFPLKEIPRKGRILLDLVLLIFLCCIDKLPILLYL
jgi:hypothetical protein